MANQFNIDSTKYDIGEPFLSVRAGNATIAHTPNGIVVSHQSGTRYTCSYQRLFSLLKANVYDPNKIETRDNINDILSKFKSECNKELVQAQKINQELLNKLNS